MKIRAIAAATAALVILAACGGSESSSTTQRTKNGVLINNNNIYNIAGSCSQSGVCKVGGVTNTGGIVISLEYGGQTNEPTGWVETKSKNFDFPGAAGPLCTNPNTKSWSATANPASGFNDTNTLANKCEVSPAMSLVEGAEPGEYIPSIDELTLLAKVLRSAGRPLPDAKCYWSSTSSSTNTTNNPAARVLALDGNGGASESDRDVTDAACALRTVKRVTVQQSQINNNNNIDITTIPNNNITNITPVQLPKPATSAPATMPPPQSNPTVPMTVPPATASSVTTMPSANTTPIKPAAAGSCASGGACAIGDTGPAGGKVFYVATSPQTLGRYLEVSPQTLDPRFDMMWCEVMPKPLTADATAADPARLLSETYARNCTKGVLRLATDLMVGKFDDWYLPTLAQVKQMYLNRDKIQIEGQWLYTTDVGVTPDGKPAPIAFYFVDGQTKAMNYLAGFAARAVRSFGPSIGDPQPLPITSPATVPITVPITAPVAPTTAAPKPTTTLPSTTTTAKPTTCATGAACKVGDIGPGSGIVFYVAASPQTWGQYLEAPTKNIATNQPWCNIVTRDVPGAQGTAIGNGKQNTIDMDAVCTSGAGQVAADFVYGGKDDWYLPARDELNAMYQQRAQLGMTGYYFSSSEANPFFAWDQFMVTGTPYIQGKSNGREVRPIRAFGPIAAPIQAPTLTTALNAAPLNPKSITTTTAPKKVTPTTVVEK